MVDLFKALADENRLRILNLLNVQELCVCEIETLLDITQSNTSRHLTKLKGAGIISSSKDAQWVHYKVSDDFIMAHKSLFDYLVSKMADHSVMKEDKRKLEKYNELGLTCTDIRKEPAHVVHLIGR